MWIDTRTQESAMRTLVCSALLCALPMSGIAAQLSVLPRSVEHASPEIIRVHHEATDNVAPAQMLPSLPADDWPMTNWYKQAVYDLLATRSVKSQTCWSIMMARTQLSSSESVVSSELAKNTLQFRLTLFISKRTTKAGIPS